MLLPIRLTEDNTCTQIDNRLECYGPIACQYASQMRYGRQNPNNEAKLMVNLMQISLLERLSSTDNMLGNEDGEEVDNSLIITQGDDFGILITTP